jgi:Flp pilus assembly protein TadG
MRTKNPQNRSEGGQALIMLVLGLVALVGFVALTIDVGLIFEGRRADQNAADAAALAGASALPADPATAKLRASDWAQKNGFVSGVGGTTVTVTTPYKGDSGKIEVVIKKPVSATFARVLGATTFPVTARAVATRSSSSGVNAAFLVLNPTKCKSFSKSGGGNLIINNNGGIMDNSSCNPSMERNGAGSVTAAAINYYKPGGYVETGSGQFSPTPTAVDSRIPDPLANLLPPDFNILGISIDSGGTPIKPATKSISSGNTTLHPGVYYGGILIKSTANVTFLPGVYVLAGSGLKLTGSGTIKGLGVMFYNTYDPLSNTGDGACGSINLRGSAHFNFTGPTSGIYKDIVFWQDKACTNDFSLEGGQGGVGGVIYVPNGRVDLSGSGNLGSIQVISDTVNISGTGDTNVNFYPYILIPLSGNAALIE